MPLLLLDLDNTLIDRQGAFRRWADDFTRRNGFQPAEVDWLVAADRDGGEQRERLAAMIRARYGLARSPADLADELRRGLVERIVLDPAVPSALDCARSAGWTLFVITHGQVAQQERKLRHTGLADHIAGWVISEGVGLRKPDPRIFQIAAQRAGQSLAGAWMIGDSAKNDIAGARRAGIGSVWLSRGRPWPCEDFAPTRIEDSCPTAIAFVISDDRVC